MLKCPQCRSKTRVTNSREAKKGKAIQRTRECIECGVRFSTQEIRVSSARPKRLWTKKESVEKEPVEEIESPYTQLRDMMQGITVHSRESKDHGM